MFLKCCIVHVVASYRCIMILLSYSGRSYNKSFIINTREITLSSFTLTMIKVTTSCLPTDTSIRYKYLHALSINEEAFTNPCITILFSERITDKWLTKICCFPHRKIQVQQMYQLVSLYIAVNVICGMRWTYISRDGRRLIALFFRVPTTKFAKQNNHSVINYDKKAGLLRKKKQNAFVCVYAEV